MDVLVRDAYRAHYALRDQRLDPRVTEVAAQLAIVTGQDIEETADGRFRIFAGTAPDRVISTVDPEARHGHKTAAHGFDGFKAHVALDPHSEVICAAEVSAATRGDGVVAPRLLDDLAAGQGEPGNRQAARAVVDGDSAYGTGANLGWLNQQGLTPMVKTGSPTALAGGSPNFSSASTSPPRRSPARHGSPSRSSLVRYQPREIVPCALPCSLLRSARRAGRVSRRGGGPWQRREAPRRSSVTTPRGWAPRPRADHRRRHLHHPGRRHDSGRRQARQGWDPPGVHQAPRWASTQPSAATGSVGSRPSATACSPLPERRGWRCDRTSSSTPKV